MLQDFKDRNSFKTNAMPADPYLSFIDFHWQMDVKKWCSLDRKQQDQDHACRDRD